MIKSEQLDKLAKAMSKAQAELTGVVKDSKAYNYLYADLHACIEACREALANNELCILQTNVPSENAVIVETTLLHSSGQFVTGQLSMPFGQKKDPQTIGAIITYARRYALTSMVGLAQKDDDAAEVTKDYNVAPQQNKANTGQPHANKDNTRKELLSNIALVMKNNSLTKEQVTAVVKDKFNKEASSDLTDDELVILLSELRRPAKSPDDSKKKQSKQDNGQEIISDKHFERLRKQGESLEQCKERLGLVKKL